LILSDVDYNSLPENRGLVLSSLLKKSEEAVNPQRVGEIISGLSQMDVSWEELEEDTCLLIERMIEKCDGKWDEQVRDSRVASFLLLLSFLIVRLYRMCYLECPLWHLNK
jgi:hypothetical protein